MAKIDPVLERAAQIGASDVHIAVGSPPMYRHLGDLKKFKSQPLTSDSTQKLLFEILTPQMRDQFKKDLQIDFSYEIQGVARYRTNIFCQRRGLDASFRVVPYRIPSLDELGLPPVVHRLLDQHQGLILVTGATGHGKSTTLASMVDHLNENRRSHIITVEDPIEFIHATDKNAVVNQRQVGRDTMRFANALKGALREDPDVIIIGELRDKETISLALTAAETGHLVIGTMSTSNTHKTVDRVIDSFPPQQQNQVRTMLADSIKGIITQRLVKERAGKHRCLATEVLVGTIPVACAIRDSKTFQIPSLLQTGKNAGMHPMDDSLMQLLKSGQILPEAGYANAFNKKAFEPHLQN
jgi:twitching motility protein PilT